MCVLGSRRCLSDRSRDCTTIYELSKAILSQSPRSVILSQVCKQIAGEYPSLPKIQLARHRSNSVGSAIVARVSVVVGCSGAGQAPEITAIANAPIIMPIIRLTPPATPKLRRAGA